MTILKTLHALDSQKKSLNTKLIDKTITVEESEAIHSQINSIVKEFNAISKKELVKFRAFCLKNKELYTSFYLMNHLNIGSSHRINEIKISSKRNAVFVLLETLHEDPRKSVVLIPFEFIESEELFLETRRKYVKNWHFNSLQLKIKRNEKELERITDENLELMNQESDFDRHYDNFIKKNKPT